MYPIKLKPIYKEVIWGGHKIAELFARDIPGGSEQKIGESWELSTHAQGMSIVANGPLAGHTLQELILTYKEQLMGHRYAADGSFPLLIKIIDANDKLSIQVHPDDDYAYRVEGEAGKTEAWYVVAAKENAQIVYGLQAGISKEDFMQVALAGQTDNSLRHVPVQAGDMVLVPAGLVHALFEGIVVYEVQQNSTATYRVYDYGRAGIDGKPRELHLDKALAVIDYNLQPTHDFNADSISCRYFSLHKLSLQGLQQEQTLGQFVVYCIISGQGAIIYDGGIQDLQPGDTVLVPACLGGYTLQGTMEALCVR